MSLEQDVLLQEQEEVMEFSYAGKHYTLAEFATSFNITEEQAAAAVEVLASQGKIDYGTEEMIADKAVRKALKEAGVFSVAQSIEQDKENELNYKREQSRAGRHIYERVTFQFGSVSSAKEFAVSVENLRLECDITLNEAGTGYDLHAYRLSDKEYSTLCNIYNTNKFINSTVAGTTRAFDNALKATDYTSKKVLVPVAKIGLAGAFKIGKSLLGTAAKIGGITVSEGIKISRDTVTQIKEDENIAIAKAELHRTKNDIIAGFNKGRTSGGNGITID